MYNTTYNYLSSIILVCSPYILSSSRFTCMASSGTSCFKAIDGDKNTFWTMEWEATEKERYSEGFVSWFELAFRQKITVSRLDLIRQSHNTQGSPCSNFGDIELSFSNGYNQSVSLKNEQVVMWETIQISPNVDTYVLRISDRSRSNNVNNICEDTFSEIRVWGCTNDYIQYDTGKTPTIFYETTLNA